ncbi:MAG TPA: YXWGXW repeat-containing protein [Thermoanaerobaculia bacterium]|nr:YXWGXW repeat-containing protein [Thermoanaerobaculia bacterium]
MTHRILKSVLPAAVAAALALPAAAQIPIPPLPHVEIHIAHSRPPRERVEYRTESPGRGYVWVRGFWDWEGGDWVWIPGRWERPAEPDAVWVQPHYYREGRDYRYEPGHWSTDRLRDGDDYREWREHHHRRHDRDHDRDRDHDHDHDHGRR